ncbi:MAG: hypothetical protein AAFY03_13555, partial [Pseudomonadota bacterium]
MTRNELLVFKNPNLMSVVLYLKHPLPRCIRHAVIIARDRDHAFMTDTPFDGEDRIIRDCRKRLQAALFEPRRVCRRLICLS